MYYYFCEIQSVLINIMNIKVFNIIQINSNLLYYLYVNHKLFLNLFNFNQKDYLKFFWIITNYLFIINFILVCFKSYFIKKFLNSFKFLSIKNFKFYFNYKKKKYFYLYIYFDFCFNHYFSIKDCFN